jgi:transposase, IS6 family
MSGLSASHRGQPTWSGVRGVGEEADHSHLKHRLRPMRGLCTERTAQVVIAGHAFMQNLRRGHSELSLDVPPAWRVAAAVTELARAI